MANSRASPLLPPPPSALSATSLTSMMSHLRHLECSITRVLMEATLKLSTLTDAGCFVFFETSEGRRFGGSAALLSEFVEGKLSADGAQLVTLHDVETKEKSLPPDITLRDQIATSSSSSISRHPTHDVPTIPRAWKSHEPPSESDHFLSPFPRKRSAINAFNDTIDLSSASSTSASSSSKSARLSGPAPGAAFHAASLCVKEEEVIALEPEDAPWSSKRSENYAVATPPLTNNAMDDDWDDDIEEIICDLDVTPVVADLKPVVVGAADECRPITLSPHSSALPRLKHSIEDGRGIARSKEAGAVTRDFPPMIHGRTDSPLLSSHSSSASRAAAIAAAAAAAASRADSYVPPQALLPHPQTDSLVAQHRPMVEALEANQTEMSLQKLDILGQQNVEEMFTKGTTAYALLKSCLYTQGKILSQLCPFKDRDIKDAEVKAFFNDNFEAILLLCPTNLRDCYFSENPFWLVDLLESASKRNSKVSLMAFVKDQARNGFKAEFKKKRGEQQYLSIGNV